jgi:hypothetical protein
MFITSTRIVGLIAVVCALIVAPQALAASSTHSRIAPPGDEPSGFDLGELKNGRAVFTAATPDAFQGNDLSGFDLGDLKNRRAVLTAATHQSLKVAMFVYMPTNPGWGAAATEAKKSASKPALAPVVKTAPVVCLGHAEYDYVDLGCEWWS